LLSAEISSVQDLLDSFRLAATDERDKGTLFERFIQRFLKVAPPYSDTFREVWTWPEWLAAETPSGFPNEKDLGIDLVAVTNEGEYWAIQCKFYEPEEVIQGEDIHSFFTYSGKEWTAPDGILRKFSQRLIVSTTEKWGVNAEAMLPNQAIPVQRIGIADIEEAAIDWSQFRPTDPNSLRRRAVKKLRDHQREGIYGNSDFPGILEGFKNHPNGKLIMACGTGKTFTALRAAEALLPAQNGRVLFLAPSISLVAQSLREWTGDAVNPITPFVVCSDSKVGRKDRKDGSEDIASYDLGYPPTTDPVRLASAISKAPTNHPVVVFCTYQSLTVIEDAQKHGLGAFDLIVCDEAHRTTGYTEEGKEESDFTLIHQHERIHGVRRLFMTATPRIYGENSKAKAGQINATVYSMDDEERYGPVFYRITFSEAIRQDLLSDYKVVIVVVDQDSASDLSTQFNSTYQVSSKEAMSIDLATKLLGAWSGLSGKHVLSIEEDGTATEVSDVRPMRRAVAFSHSIDNSKTIVQAFKRLNELSSADEHQARGLVNCRLDHVDGSMNAMIRADKLAWLKGNEDGECRILSNARCLSEGIDVPTLDAVIFFDTRESVVDIIQSVGRVMRKADGKEYGYIILPVCIPKDDVASYDSYIDKDQDFKGVWKVIKALRAHDESLVDIGEIHKKIKVLRLERSSKKRDDDDDDMIPLPILDIGKLSESIYAAVPSKLGDTEYWADWAKRLAPIVKNVKERIESLRRASAAAEADFAIFLKGLQENINPGISDEDAVDMLSQHVITRPIFDAVFGGSKFTDTNPVSQAMQGILEHLDANAVSSETTALDRFYDQIRDRLANAKSAKSRQDVIRRLYDSFFKTAFSKTAQRLGIVYTPVEIVDFMLRSVDWVLRESFGSSLAKPDVHIIDPFTGTGTFLVRLIQSGLISSDRLPHKYREELHANEILLLPYYIASVNIENAYLTATGRQEPFEGIVLTDTFQSYGSEQGDIFEGFSRENSERLNRQRKLPIRVIIGNPPYSSNQKSANDDNRGQRYPALGSRIAETYAKNSKATSKQQLYNGEILALRWATDRIGDWGVLAYVTNSAFLDKTFADGLRRCLESDYHAVYVFDLGGAITGKVGEERRQIGGNVFGEGSKNGIAIIVAVRNPTMTTPGLFHYGIDDSLDRAAKLEFIETATIESLPWNRITPNAAADWINQRDKFYETLYLPLADDDANTAIFSASSHGIKTQRDAWVYNFSREALTHATDEAIQAYNETLDIKAINRNDRRIKWTENLERNKRRGVVISKTSEDIIRNGLYRPFTVEHLAFSPHLIDRPANMASIFPTKHHQNSVICVSGPGSRKPFTAIITDKIPNLHTVDTCQCFPRFVYEQQDKERLFHGAGLPDEHGFIKRSAIGMEALLSYREQYVDSSIGDDDVFYHVYGLLHATDYRNKHQNDVKKMLARIPYPKDFWAFAAAGRELSELHLNYENVEPYILAEEGSLAGVNYKVGSTAMRFLDGRTAIRYNDTLTLRGLPPEALEYQVNGWPAIQWIMERYSNKLDEESGIRDDANEWAPENSRYIVDLIKRVVTVSVETMRIVKALPPALPPGA